MPERHLFLVATSRCASAAESRPGPLRSVRNRSGRCSGSPAPAHAVAAAIQDTPGSDRANAGPHARPGLLTAATRRADSHPCDAASGERSRRAGESRPRDVLLVHVSHELRMQLNAIIGYSEMLQKEATERIGQGIAADGRQNAGAEVHQIHAASLHLHGAHQ